MLVCGAPQFNKTFGKGGTVAAGYFKRLPHEQRNSHVVYKIELTAKGSNKAKPVAAETAKPVKKARPTAKVMKAAKAIKAAKADAKANVAEAKAEYVQAVTEAEAPQVETATPDTQV
jgi:hypothetical protein